MISTSQIAQAVITQLKATVALTDLVGDEVREENWMSDNYKYPQVRVHVTRLAPIGQAGSCEDTALMADFSVVYRSANSSSKPTADGLQVAVEALVPPGGGGFRLGLAGEFVPRSAVKLQDAPGPIPESEHVWLARAFFHCKIQEI